MHLIAKLRAELSKLLDWELIVGVQFTGLEALDGR